MFLSDFIKYVEWPRPPYLLTKKGVNYFSIKFYFYSRYFMKDENYSGINLDMREFSWFSLFYYMILM